MGLRIMKVTPKIFLDFFKAGKHAGYECIANPLPEDVGAVGMSYDIETDEFSVLLYSTAWKKHLMGGMITEIDKPVFRKSYSVWD